MIPDLVWELFMMEKVDIEEDVEQDRIEWIQCIITEKVPNKVIDDNIEKSLKTYPQQNLDIMSLFSMKMNTERGYIVSLLQEQGNGLNIQQNAKKMTPKSADSLFLIKRFNI